MAGLQLTTEGKLGIAKGTCSAARVVVDQLRVHNDSDPANTRRLDLARVVGAKRVVSVSSTRSSCVAPSVSVVRVRRAVVEAQAKQHHLLTFISAAPSLLLLVLGFVDGFVLALFALLSVLAVLGVAVVLVVQARF